MKGFNVKKLLISLSFLLLALSNSVYPQWYQQKSGINSNLYSIFSIDGEIAWTCGADGIILKTTNCGASWIPKYSGTNVSLSFIMFFDKYNGITLGSGGTILKSSDGGETWCNVFSGTTIRLQEASFINSQIGWAVGDFGIVLKTIDGGECWSALCYATDDNFDCVYFIDQDLGWASTEKNGEIWKTTDGGLSWQLKYNTLDNTKLWQIQFVDSETGWASGEKSTLLKTIDGGETWKPQKIGYENVSIRTINFRNTRDGWIAGKHPALFRTTTGGVEWCETERINNSELLYLFFFNDEIGWTIGTRGTILFTDNNGGPLPLKLENFSAIIEDNTVSIFWQTSSELSNKGFEIQRKKDEGNWYDIAFLNGAGTNQQLKNYKYLDKLNSSGTYYYRLKQLSTDGKVTFFDEVKIIFE